MCNWSFAKALAQRLLWGCHRNTSRKQHMALPTQHPIHLNKPSPFVIQLLSVCTVNHCFRIRASPSIPLRQWPNLRAQPRGSNWPPLQWTRGSLRWIYMIFAPSGLSPEPFVSRKGAKAERSGLTSHFSQDGSMYREINLAWIDLLRIQLLRSLFPFFFSIQTNTTWL